MKGRHSHRLRLWHLIGAALVLSAAPAYSDVIRINIDKVTFSPAEARARIGDTIEWVNAGFIAHTATARSKAWDVIIAPGKTSRLEIDRAGAVDYFCRFHPNMAGRIDVTAD